MKVSNLISQAFNSFKSSQYHIRGKPKRVYNDPSVEKNLSMKEQYYRQKLERLEKLEKAQLSGVRIPKKV